MSFERSVSYLAECMFVQQAVFPPTLIPECSVSCLHKEYQHAVNMCITVDVHCHCLVSPNCGSAHVNMLLTCALPHQTHPKEQILKLQRINYSILLSKKYVHVCLWGGVRYWFVSLFVQRSKGTD